MAQPFLIPGERAHFERNIKLLLQPYFEFRLYIVFKTAEGRPGPKRHFYGNEHQCTYTQLLHQKLPFISMDKLKGYNELIKLVEESYKGKYIGAKIYGREPGQEQFSILHRDYLRGELKECHDPVIAAGDQYYNLSYLIEKGRVIIGQKVKN